MRGIVGNWVTGRCPHKPKVPKVPRDLQILEGLGSVTPNVTEGTVADLYVITCVIVRQIDHFGLLDNIRKLIVARTNLLGTSAPDSEFGKSDLC